MLEVLQAFDHPFTIITKSAMVVRDLDIIGPMASRGLAKVTISITTLDRRLARRMEPRAATPAKRLDTIRRLVVAGVPTTVMVAPVIPALNDIEIEDILKEAAKPFCYPAGLHWQVDAWDWILSPSHWTRSNSKCPSRHNRK
tara:strand:+ start:104 stop:529 length:426 start_codon:yes stop_codon:yes gene_type:complete